jgi:hypothetical protein
MGVTPQFFPYVVNRSKKISASAIHLVYEGNSWNTIFVHLAPNCLGLWLDTGNTTEYGNRSIKYSERTLNLGRKIDVPRSVYYIYSMAYARKWTILRRPRTGYCGGSNRDSSLPFLLHPVSYRSAIVNLAHPMHDTGVEQYAFRCRRFTGINVRGNPDVSRKFQRRATGFCIRRRYFVFGHLPSFSNFHITSADAQMPDWLVPCGKLLPFS